MYTGIEIYIVCIREYIYIYMYTGVYIYIYTYIYCGTQEQSGGSQLTNASGFANKSKKQMLGFSARILEMQPRQVLVDLSTTQNVHVANICFSGVKM